MTTAKSQSIFRRNLFRALLLLPFSAAAFLVSGCALPLLMRSAVPKKTAPEKFSCGEDCPPARKHVNRTK
jgi:hypothetical protein